MMMMMMMMIVVVVRLDVNPPIKYSIDAFEDQTCQTRRLANSVLCLQIYRTLNCQELQLVKKPVTKLSH